MDITMKKSTKTLALLFLAALLCAAVLLNVPAVQAALLALGGKMKGAELRRPDLWLAAIKGISLKCIVVAVVADVLVFMGSVCMPRLVHIFRNSNVTADAFTLPDSCAPVSSAKKWTDLGIGIVLVALLVVVFFVDGLNTLAYKMPGYDDAYNATVSANFAKYGEYRVSYPAEITFYNMITTGHIVLLPTAWLFRVFGINGTTLGFVPLVYATVSIVLLFLLFSFCYGERSGKYVLSAFLCICMVLSSKWFLPLSTTLLGESAAICFLLCSLLNLICFYKSRKRWSMFLAGFFLPAAFISKSAMIFFVFTFLALLSIECFVLKQITRKAFFAYVAGFLVGFCAFDFFKLIALGSPRKYVLWWVKEFLNMVSQSSGSPDEVYSIKDKVIYLSEIFDGYPVHFCLVLMMLPVVIYAVYFLSAYAKKHTVRGVFPALLIAGMGGVSLVWYFVLLGGSGLVYARRQSVNALFAKLFFVYLLGFVVLKFLSCRTQKSLRFRNVSLRKSATMIAALYLSFSCFIFSSKQMAASVVAYAHKEKSLSYTSLLMRQFLAEVSNLPDNAVLYCANWWQEPSVTLYLERPLHDITAVLEEKSELAEESYFIVGRFIHNVDKSDLEQKLNRKFEKIGGAVVDYMQYAPVFDRKDFDCFAIYALRQ